MLAPRGMWNWLIDGEAKQLSHVSSLDILQIQGGRQTRAELPAGWPPLAEQLTPCCWHSSQHEVWCFLLQNKPLAGPRQQQKSNAELKAASPVLQQLSGTPAWEHNQSIALLQPQHCLWEGNSGSGAPPAAPLVMSLMSVCPHLDVIQLPVPRGPSCCCYVGVSCTQALKHRLWQLYWSLRVLMNA